MRRRLAALVTMVVVAVAACSSSDGDLPDASADTSARTSATTESSTTPQPDSLPSSSARPSRVDTDAPIETDAPTSAVEDVVANTDAAQSAADVTSDRPFEVYVPSSYEASTPAPLVLLLHGYTSSGDGQESYFKFEPLAEERGFLYVHPDGTIDESGNRYWNATDACCSFGKNTPDDSSYVKAVIDQVSAEYNVDPKRIFLAGHSNGGFMSYRMACDHADTIAAIATLAGATFGTSAVCAPSEPVSVLQVHGTDDAVIGYGGDEFEGAIVPSAEETVALWAGYNGCDPAPIDAPDQLDLDIVLDGTDSDVSTFDGCASGSDVELWTINGGSHSPALSEQFTVGAIDFLLAHPKP
jgi:polyhydroxybutyrate depolymerase